MSDGLDQKQSFDKNERTQQKNKPVFTKEDLVAFQSQVKEIIAARKEDPFRKEAEREWCEIDRQVRMKPMEVAHVAGADPREEDWHNTIEMGDMARASELITADVMRLVFPNRPWLQPHANLTENIERLTEGMIADAQAAGKEIGQTEIEREVFKLQRNVDSRLLAYMGQQFKDFGFKKRFKLSVKEALHHGGFVTEVVQGKMSLSSKGGKIHNTIAPVWQPHSMWNSFPDPSASVMSTNIFYTGSMLIRTWKKHHQMVNSKNKNRFIQLDKVEKRTNKMRFGTSERETEDVEIFRWLGPIVLETAKKETIYIPNVKAIMANDVLIHISAADLPFSNIIYEGYEQNDVLDPYYTSPMLKNTSWQLFNSRAANKFLDSVDLETEPPLTYDVNDPEHQKTNGPRVAPATQFPVSNPDGVRPIQVGSSTSALAGLRMGLEQHEKNVGSDANRAGVASEVEQTATEARNVAQRSEVRTVDFVETLEQGGLKPYLYMHHYMNVKYGMHYPFYNSAPGQRDFDHMAPKQLPKEVHFEIIGSKNVLGEDERNVRMLEVTKFFASLPETKHIPNYEEIAKLAYQDAGIKQVESVLNIRTDADRELVDARVAKLQEELEALTKAAQETEQELLKRTEKAENLATQAEHESRKKELDKAEADSREQEQRKVNEGLRNTISSLKREITIINRTNQFKDGVVKQSIEMAHINDKDKENTETKTKGVAKPKGSQTPVPNQ